MYMQFRAWPHFDCLHLVRFYADLLRPQTAAIYDLLTPATIKSERRCSLTRPLP